MLFVWKFYIHILFHFFLFSFGFGSVVLARFRPICKLTAFHSSTCLFMFYLEIVFVRRFFFFFMVSYWNLNKNSHFKMEIIKNCKSSINSNPIRSVRKKLFTLVWFWILLANMKRFSHRTILLLLCISNDKECVFFPLHPPLGSFSCFVLFFFSCSFVVIRIFFFPIYHQFMNVI